MINKKFILNADDFGISHEVNQAIIKGFKEGFLTSASIMANGEFFDEAVFLIKDYCDFGLGVHLNIIEGKTLCVKKENSMLYDTQGNYKNNFIELFLKSYNQDFLDEVETDFRLQIEKILKYQKTDHINSHVHTHSIPNIFNIVSKLAKEYDIKYVRIQNEKAYLVNSIKKHLTFKYPLNLIKFGLLNVFTFINKKTLKKYGLKSNDYFIGITYTGYMDKDTIWQGLQAIQEEDCIVEAIVHPTIRQSEKANYNEYLTILDDELHKKISEQNWVLLSFNELN